MKFQGYVWTGGAWRKVCEGHSIPEVSKELDRLAPVKDNRHHTITQGGIPSGGEPGVLDWERPKGGKQ